MFCEKCGKEVKEDTKFCSSCGNVINAQVGSIIFARKTQFSGSVVPITIYMDGNLIGDASIGDELEVPTTVGKHEVTLKFWGIKVTDEIELTEENPNIKVVFKLKMGLLMSKPKIIDIINL